MRVVVVGGSFGGMTTAYELRKKLAADECQITVISKDRRFTFIPSLPWVTMGWRDLDKISFDLEAPLARRDIQFVEASVRRIDPGAKTVITDRETLSYDYLVLATGHRSANEAVPGPGPFDGPGHSPHVAGRGG